MESNFNPQFQKIGDILVYQNIISAEELEKFQFQRIGYFCIDKESTKDHLVFNRTVTLRDSWAKKQK